VQQQDDRCVGWAVAVWAACAGSVEMQLSTSEAASRRRTDM
jgi:hypothetical protein